MQHLSKVVLILDHLHLGGLADLGDHLRECSWGHHSGADLVGLADLGDHLREWSWDHHSGAHPQPNLQASHRSSIDCLAHFCRTDPMMTTTPTPDLDWERRYATQRNARTARTHGT